MLNIIATANKQQHAHEKKRILTKTFGLTRTTSAKKSIILIAVSSFLAFIPVAYTAASAAVNVNNPKTSIVPCF